MGSTGILTPAAAIRSAVRQWPLVFSIRWTKEHSFPYRRGEKSPKCQLLNEFRGPTRRAASASKTEE